MATRSLIKGDLLAHQTATIAGVVASLGAVTALQRFKQRQGPFLLLAASIGVALKLSRFRSKTLQNMAASHWPGPVTLVFSARKGLPAACYHRGTIAVRVDASPEVRCLAKEMGGVIVSSSLNRRKRATLPANRNTHLRLSRWLNGRIKSSHKGSGKASAIFLIKGKKIKKLR
ncbi:MAG: Sua5/YciO/YrdC/YwlC family protein [Mariprofundaceae bacterium]|nr:Sua5/YciO/YrdC/YwlC family protein [Mariprofundaceae bacterium]